MHFSYSS